MISEFEHIEEFFKELDSKLSKKLSVYVIGGAVLLHQGLKPATKDIDLVVYTKKEFFTINGTLQKLGFEDKISGKEYERFQLNQIFQREDFRIDVFCKEVCGKFSLSKTMIERANKVLGLNHLQVFLCSNEDVFLFKTMTEREGDLTDCLNLATRELDWDAMLEELKHQMKESKQDVWITWVGERLDLLEDRELKIPIMEEMNKLQEEFLERLEKRLIK